MSECSRLPDDIIELATKKAGEFHFGVIVHESNLCKYYSVVLSRAVESGLRETVTRMMEKAAEILPRKPFENNWEIKQAIKKAIEQAIEKHFNDLIDAARLPPRVRRWEQEIAAKLDEVRNTVAETRNQCLREIKEFTDRRREARKLMVYLAAEWNYPPIPDGHLVPSEKGDGLPYSPGIYFAWRDGRVVYVGQSRKLANRANLYHANITSDDLLSWLEFPLAELNFAEAFYIGAARPIRNFGLNARTGGGKKPARPVSIHQS